MEAATISEPLGRIRNRHFPSNSELTTPARISKNRKILEHLSQGLTVRYDPSFGPLVHPSGAEEPVQRWFQYREGYTIELCKRLFLPNESFVIDPFCGFGSTLLAARNAGLESAGLDVNPLAAFVAKVKTRTYGKSQIADIRNSILLLSSLTKRAPAAPSPALRILGKLFHKDILHALSIFRFAITSLPQKRTREFLFLGWVAILEEVSNVYREGNGVKYRNRIRRGNKYTVKPYDEWQAEKFPSNKFKYVRDILLSKLELMTTEAGESLRRGPEPLIVQACASKAASLVPKEGASLAIFSPPYCNCFNYIKAYKLELWMAGFIRTYPDIRALTAKGLRSRVESLLDPVHDPYPPIIEDLVSLMSKSKLWSPQLPDVVRGYFADMQRTMAVLVRSIKRGGRCIIVVGNSAYGGVLIPSDLLLAHIASSLGFQVKEIVVARHLTTSSQQKRSLAPLRDYLRESIIHLERN